MNLSQVYIDGFYESINSQEYYFTTFQVFMEVTSIINLALVISVFHLLSKYGKTIKIDYRQVLLLNLMLPAIFSLYMGFIYQPYIVFPYHLLLTIGFFRFGPFVTAHLFNICCSLAILCSMGLIYSFWFNYWTICYRITKRSSVKSNSIGMAIGIVFTIVNFILMTVGVNEFQHEDWATLTNNDTRIRYFLETYSIAVVRVDQKWSLKVLSIEAFVGITIVVIVIPIITMKSYKALNNMHKQVSKSTVTTLKNALIISLCYLFQFGVLVGIPAVISMTLLLLQVSPSKTFPLAVFILAPTQLTCPVICILYICVIKQLRNVVVKTLNLQKFKKNLTETRSTQSQFSAVSFQHRSSSHRAPFSLVRLN